MSSILCFSRAARPSHIEDRQTRGLLSAVELPSQQRSQVTRCFNRGSSTPKPHPNASYKQRQAKRLDLRNKAHRLPIFRPWLSPNLAKEWLSIKPLRHLRIAQESIQRLFAVILDICNLVNKDETASATEHILQIYPSTGIQASEDV